MGSIQIVLDDEVGDDGQQNDIDALGDCALAHDGDDVVCFGVILLKPDHFYQCVPDQPIEQLQGDRNQN